MIPQKKVERFIEFVRRLRPVQFKTTSSEVLMKNCGFVFCIFINLQSEPHLRKTWAVFPLLLPREPGCLIVRLTP